MHCPLCRDWSFQNYLLAIKSFESMAKFKYLVLTLAIKVAFVKELKSSLKSEKNLLLFCPEFLFPGFPFKNIKIKICRSAIFHGLREERRLWGCSRIGCWERYLGVRSLELCGSRILDEICRNISRPRRVTPFAARGLSHRWTWRQLAEKVGTSKGGGKQWQPTPKNLPRMQCARAIPVDWLGSGSC